MTKRRTFLAQIGAGSVLTLLPSKTKDQISSSIDKRDMTIDAVEVLKLSGPYQTKPGTNRQYQSQSRYIYPELKPKPYVEKNDATIRDGRLSRYYLRVKTKGGLEGIYGMIDPQCIWTINEQMADFLIGKNAMDVEKLWDQLYRRNRHGRAGHYMMALSAIDNVLWDLRGRYFDAPVYDLLGGSTRGEEVEVYGSCLGFSVEKGKAGPQAKALFDKGFTRQKWFMVDGPADGPAGLKKSIDLVREIREAVGDNLQLMFDAYMAWDLPFATQWAKEVERYNPYWLEEAFIPNRMHDFAALAKETTIQVATGEHFYNRWEAANFLRADAISVVQADPEWCGGVSELVKICHIASAFGAKVFPHGHNIPAAMHVVASQSPDVCPLVEYLINHVPSKVNFMKNPLVTSNGKLPLPKGPGFDITLDDNKYDELLVV